MLTRDFLMNADCKTAFGAIEESLLWSAEQRAASLAATLACRPDDGSVWIFGYGSLIWNPALNYRESCTGTLPGWHRAFCLRLTAGRGSACQPGRMLALKEGGRTTGVAYRLPDDTLEEAKELQEKNGGFVKTMWCGDLACELKMKEVAGMSSRCIPFQQEHLGDTCAICGKPAKKMIYWGVAY